MTISKWADYKSSAALSMPFVLNSFLCLPHNAVCQNTGVMRVGR